MRLASLFLLLFFWLLPARAQQAEAHPEEVSIGLVLSGGGAKGLAHVGALKVIEEAGVRIDYIGGTSMGAIVGALYASGYSATQLDSLFTYTDLAALIQDEFPRSAKTSYEKQNSERYAITLPFDKFKITFPQAISGGQNIYNELVRALYHVKDVSDFSQLPIPFYCIATDVETGEEILLEEGYLPEAIMASGTLPSLFEPTEVNGRILIDGGVLNNFPIEEMREKGADIVVGVDVQHGLRDRESLTSATDILLQINSYRTLGNLPAKVERTDIYIRPDIDQYSVIDFDSKRQIIEAGSEAARKVFDQLQSAGASQTLRREPGPRPTGADTLVVNRLLIRGNNNYSRGYVKGKLRVDLAKPVPFSKLRQGIGNLAATGNFKTIRYQLTSNGLGQDLILKLQENPQKTSIRISAHYDDLFKSAALINLTHKNLLFPDDVGSFDLMLGDNIRYNALYYVDKGSYWSFGFNSRLDSFDQNLDYNVILTNFEGPIDPNINRISLDVSDLTNQFYVQTEWKEEFALRLGIEHKLLKYSTETLNPLEDDGSGGFQPTSASRTFFENSNYFSVFGKLALDTYDDRYLPSRGLYLDGDFHVYLFSSDFNDNFKEFSIGKARLGAAFPLFGNLSLNLETEGGFKLGTSRVAALDFILGGLGSIRVNNFIPFFGYDFLSLPGNSYVKAFARTDWEFVPKSHLLFTANIANVEDDIFRTGEWFTAPDFTGYGVGYAWESFFGPLQVHYTWSPEGNTEGFFFSLGYWF